MPALVVTNLSAGYGLGKAIDGVSLEIAEGARIALVGSNGAGKSTLVRTICGLHRQSEGKIVWNNQDISQLPGHSRTRLGIATVAEGRLLFAGLTVRENLLAASLGGEPKARRAKSLELVFELFPPLASRQHQQAGTMSGGEQQMLAIGRALMTLPQLLILDEPSIGLAPRIVTQIFAALEALGRGRMSLLLVEQNVRLSLRTVDYAYVLSRGKIVRQGDAKDLMESDFVKQAYLGNEIH